MPKFVVTLNYRTEVKFEVEAEEGYEAIKKAMNREGVEVGEERIEIDSSSGVPLDELKDVLDPDNVPELFEGYEDDGFVDGVAWVEKIK